jgi:protein-S-isoprenylcysteine O-methyltransferase Ste14
MKGVVSALYSACVYAFFFATFLFAIGFVEGLSPKTIDSGDTGPLPKSLVIDLALLTLFALQHSIMARPAFKRIWTRIIPAETERSTYVLFASVALAFLVWQWRALPQMVWKVYDPHATEALRFLSFAGFGIVLLSTFLISHFHLFGISQGFARLLGRKPAELKFTTPLFYRWVRHPLYSGFVLAFWATPKMSLGHLVFALTTTGYIFLGIWLEERDLIAHFGERYTHYREQVGMLVPKFRWRTSRPLTER